MRTKSAFQSVSANQQHDSSAGWETNRLSHDIEQSPSDHAAGTGQGIVALALIAFGIIWLLIRVINLDISIPSLTAFSDPRATVLFTPALIIFNIAGAGLLLAFWRRWYLFLALGCLFVGIGLGEAGRLGYLFYTWSSYTEPAWGTNAIPFLWGLALSMLSLQLLGQQLFNIQYRWLFFLVIGLIIGGFSITAMAFTSLVSAALIWLPLVLTGVGVLLFSRHKP